MHKSKTILASSFVALLGLTSTNVWASSHSEAPGTAEDPCADSTDVYAFISPNDDSKLVVIANYMPLLKADSGPNFKKFCDSVAYDIRFDNNGDAKTDLTYRFLFKSTLSNPDSFLYNNGAVTSLTDENLNVRQTMDVIKLNRRDRFADSIASDIPVAPWYVGKNTFTDDDGYNTVANAARHTTSGDLKDQIKIFAGPRDESFFLDLHVFDVLGIGSGNRSLDGLNVLSIVMELPIKDLFADGVQPAETTHLGIHTTASRRRVRVLRRNRAARDRGRFVQVSRLGFPLVNELLIPLKDKDKFNRSRPEQDVANIASYLLDPELARTITAVFPGVTCKAAPRNDIIDVVSVAGAVTAADLLRINVAQGQTFAQSSFPNGRWLEDDVIDIALNVVCAEVGGAVLADGVDANDKAVSQTTFPYMGTPHSGNP